MKNNKFLIILSLLLVITHGVFIIINYNNIRRDQQENIQAWATNTQNTFNLSLNEKATAMQQLATYVGNDPEIKHIFLKAKTALQNNNNDYNAPEVKKIRNILYRSVKPSWDVMRSAYDVRQLHFHFGPGSTSFLRVHKPQKYGDNMDTVRYTIIDAITLLKPTKGFETGRIYSGIRGVIPVIATDESSGQKMLIGALEAGTSFSFLLHMLHEELSTNFAILLAEEHIKKNMWDESVLDTFAPSTNLGPFFIEDSTKPPSETKKLFSHLAHNNIAEKVGSCLVEIDTQCYQVTHFPLRDYRGNLNPDLPDAGMILAWNNITTKCDAVRIRVRNNIFFAIFSLILLEIILITGWHIGSRRLKQIIKDQTAELESLATCDQLTGILNRWKFEEHFTREINRHRRYDTMFSVLMFDLDHFKVVNDTWGHDVGDKVLKEIVAQTIIAIRDIDIFARWGGEEFIILLPQTDIHLAKKIAERIRLAIEKTTINDIISITISLGVVQYNKDESMDETIKRADDCLYEAKDSGRNRVCGR